MLKNLSKKKRVLVCVIILILIIIIILIGVQKKEDRLGYVPNLEGQEIKNEFESLNNEISEDGKEYPEVKIATNNILKYTTISEVLNIINSAEDAVIYFGYPSCVYCRTAIQVLADTAKETELEVIYYLNVDETDSRYNELVSALGKELTTIEDEKKLYIPLVIFIVEGKVVSYNKGTLFSQKDPYEKLDDSQVEGLSEIYRYGINDVVSSKNLKNNR